MKWFINSTKESAGFSNDYEERIKVLENRIKVLNERFDFITKITDKLFYGLEEVRKNISDKKQIKNNKHIRYAGTYSQSYYDKPFGIAYCLQSNHTQDYIANELNIKGFRTPRGNEFKSGNVSDLLQNKWLLKRYLKKNTKNVPEYGQQVDFLHGLS